MGGDVRIRQKQASRDRDVARLRSGEVGRLSLQAENDFFRGLNLSAFHIAAIGDRPLEVEPAH